MSDIDTVAAIGALTDPIRMRLFRFIVDRGNAVSRDEVSEALDISPAKAKFHLERLADEGLLETEYRRMTGRQGPGAGRPAKLYRRSATEFQVSLPERRYDIMGSILANAVEKTRAGETLNNAIDSSAYERGRASAVTVEDERGRDALREPFMCAKAALTALGYEAEVAELEPTAEGQRDRESAGTCAGAHERTPARVLRLRNCPFDALARDHKMLVCGTNVHYVQGILDVIDGEGLVATLEPAQGYCCVAVRDTTN